MFRADTVDCQTPRCWNMGLGQLMLPFPLLQTLGLEDRHIPTLWLLLYVAALTVDTVLSSSCQYHDCFYTIKH